MHMLHLGPDRVEEDGGIVRVEGAAKTRLAASQWREEPGDSGDVEKTVQRLDGQDEEERGEGVPLPEATAVQEAGAYLPVEDNAGGGGGKHHSDPISPAVTATSSIAFLCIISAPFVGSSCSLARLHHTSLSNIFV
jgi:hypothetical protein